MNENEFRRAVLSFEILHYSSDLKWNVYLLGACMYVYCQSRLSGLWWLLYIADVIYFSVYVYTYANGYTYIRSISDSRKFLHFAKHTQAHTYDIYVKLRILCWFNSWIGCATDNPLKKKKKIHWDREDMREIHIWWL